MHGLKLVPYLFILLFIISQPLGQPYFTMQTRAADINISGELVTDFTYSHVKEGIPDIIKRDMETDENVFLQLNISGLYNDYQYNVRVKGNTSDFTFDLEGITLSCIAGPTLFEIGKRRWIWGKGFSYSPTYPLDKEKDYWGSEWTLVKNNYNMAIGAVLDEDSDELYSGWVRLISLLTTSDYTVVLSYLNDKINTEIRGSGGQVLQVRIPEDYINLGVNYSRDFLNGLEIHGGLNIRHSDNIDEVSQQYLIGGEYIFKNDKTLIFEYFHENENYLVLALNHSGIFSNWQWGVRELVNLDDYGEIRVIDLSYVGNDDVVPSIELRNYAGPDNSQIAQNPRDWVINLKITVKI